MGAGNSFVFLAPGANCPCYGSDAGSWTSLISVLVQENLIYVLVGGANYPDSLPEMDLVPWLKFKEFPLQSLWLIVPRAICPLCLRTTKDEE